MYGSWFISLPATINALEENVSYVINKKPPLIQNLVRNSKS